MATCELTGKRPVVKNLVSHSNIKTKKIAQPNVQKRRLFSQALKSFVTLKVAASTLRSMEHVGGFDRYIVKADESQLSPRALVVQRKVKKSLVKGSQLKSKKAAVQKGAR